MSTISNKSSNSDSNGDVISLWDRHLEEPLKRETTLHVAKTLGLMRQESNLNLDSTGNIGSTNTVTTDHNFTLGPKLGQGGFSSVHQVVISNNTNGDNNDTTTTATYACKFLSNETLADPDRLPIAAADIVREAHFLSHLSHPNIIKLHGIGSVEDMAQYYLLLDLVQVPLSSKLETDWNNMLATVANDQLYERLEYAMDIAQAMAYLHSQYIVYRDLKIDNIGVEAVTNNVVIYDFGLAKELKGKGDAFTDKYNLSGGTGSWAYMAPEVKQNWKYNLKVDVYSFGIVLWELCSGKYAFGSLSGGRGNDLSKDDRPPMVRNWPTELEDLMRECWHWNSTNRPTFDQIEERLQQVMDDNPSRYSKRGGNGILTGAASWISGSVAAATSAVASVVLTGGASGDGN